MAERNDQNHHQTGRSEVELQEMEDEGPAVSYNSNASLDNPPCDEPEPTEFTIQCEDLDTCVMRSKELCQGVQATDELTLEPINQYYFMKLLIQSQDTMQQEEAERVNDVYETLVNDNPEMIKEFEIICSFVELVNCLISKWDLLKKQNMEYKTEQRIDVLKVFDTKDIKSRFLSLQMVWAMCPNSPLRFLETHLYVNVKEIHEAT